MTSLHDTESQMPIQSLVTTPLGVIGAALAVGAVAAMFVLLPLAAFFTLLAGVAVFTFLLIGRGVGVKLLALYWIAFCIFSTILTQFVIGGMFVIFYMGLALALVGHLVRGGVKIDVPAVWIFALLFLCIFASLIGFQGSLGGAALDRLLFVPLGAVAALLTASSATPRHLFGAMVVASIAVATWVVVRAAQSGFTYRGSIEIDQNVVSYFVGVGFALCFAWFVSRAPRSGGTALEVVGLITLALLGYALVLLASRGTMIAVGVVVVVSLFHVAFTSPRKIFRLVILVLLLSSGLLLPGGRGILERFEDPSTETGGGRVLIWDTVLDATVASGPSELLFGHGMTASSQLVKDRFAYLTSTHSSYLLMLYDYGVLGVTLFLLLHVLVALRVLRRNDGFASQLLALLVFQMAIGLFITASDNYLYWIALGAMLGATLGWLRNSRSSRAHAPPSGTAVRQLG